MFARAWLATWKMSLKRVRDQAGDCRHESQTPPSKREKKQEIKEDSSPYSLNKTQEHSNQKGALLEGDGMKTLAIKQTRFPWGNSTCQDLITQAFLSSSKRPLTLKELFSWLERHHLYFARRSHIAKSEGWKKYVYSTLVAKECFTQRRDDKSGKIVWELAVSEPWVICTCISSTTFPVHFGGKKY